MKISYYLIRLNRDLGKKDSKELNTIWATVWYQRMNFQPKPELNLQNMII